MHILEVQTTGVTCNCGYHKDTITAAEARRLAYAHAEVHPPAMISANQSGNDDSV